MSGRCLLWGHTDGTRVYFLPLFIVEDVLSFPSSIHWHHQYFPILDGLHCLCFQSCPLFLSHIVVGGVWYPVGRGWRVLCEQLYTRPQKVDLLWILPLLEHPCQGCQWWWGGRLWGYYPQYPLVLWKQAIATVPDWKRLIGKISGEAWLHSFLIIRNNVLKPLFFFFW